MSMVDPQWQSVCLLRIGFRDNIRDNTLHFFYARATMKTSSLRSGSAVFLLTSLLQATAAEPPAPNEILLKDYKPRSIFKIPETRVEKARYRAVDVHSHDYGPTAADAERWVNTMDA